MNNRSVILMMKKETRERARQAERRALFWMCLHAVVAMVVFGFVVWAVGQP